MPKKLCSWCKREDWEPAEASALVRGVYWNDHAGFSGRRMPFRAWLCEMHQAADRIEWQKLVRHAPEPERLVECPSCGGGSVTWTITCHVCNNTGKVTTEESEWQRRTR